MIFDNLIRTARATQDNIWADLNLPRKANGRHRSFGHNALPVPWCSATSKKAVVKLYGRKSFSTTIRCEIEQLGLLFLRGGKLHYSHCSVLILPSDSPNISCSTPLSRGSKHRQQRDQQTTKYPHKPHIAHDLTNSWSPWPFHDEDTLGFFMSRHFVFPQYP